MTEIVRFVRKGDNFAVAGSGRTRHVDLAEQLGLDFEDAGMDKYRLSGNYGPDNEDVDMGFVYGDELIGTSSSFDVPRVKFGEENNHPARKRSLDVWKKRDRNST